MVRTVGVRKVQTSKMNESTEERKHLHSIKAIRAQTWSFLVCLAVCMRAGIATIRPKGRSPTLRCCWAAMPQNDVSRLALGRVRNDR
jgi:hypothetical protein